MSRNSQDHKYNRNWKVLNHYYHFWKCTLFQIFIIHFSQHIFLLIVKFRLNWQAELNLQSAVMMQCPDKHDLFWFLVSLIILKQNSEVTVLFRMAGTYLMSISLYLFYGQGWVISTARCREKVCLLCVEWQYLVKNSFVVRACLITNDFILFTYVHGHSLTASYSNNTPFFNLTFLVLRHLSLLSYLLLKLWIELLFSII